MKPIDYVLLGILGVIVILIIIIFVRALLYKPKKEEKITVSKVDVDTKRAAYALGKMIKCKTVSNVDDIGTDFKEFDKFVKVLKELYPTVFKKCKFEQEKDYGLCFTLKGKDSSKCNVIMAHYDVVPVTNMWKHDPFLGEVIDGHVYGRGALDTKSTLAASLEALEDYLKKGYVPFNDLYLCFGSNEEVFGESEVNRVKIFEKKNIKPILVFDEGGGIMQKAFPGVKKDAAMIGVTEKGMMNVTLSYDGNGGHSSTPKKNSPVVRLSKAIASLDSHPMKPKFTKTSLGLLDAMGRETTFGLKLIFANLWLFKGLVAKLFTKMSADTNALLATTFVPTIISGGNATNIIPNHCEVNINIRMSPLTNSKEVVKHITKVIKDKSIKVEIVKNGISYPETDIQGDAYKLISKVTKETYGDVVISPFIMLGGTDSRHFTKISDNVIRFSPMIVSGEDRKGIHGLDEKIKVEALGKMVEFYKRLLNNL